MAIVSSVLYNFGCAPALILYFWGLNQLAAVGWIAALVFAICAGLRLARNDRLETQNHERRQHDRVDRVVRHRAMRTFAKERDANAVAG